MLVGSTKYKCSNEIVTIVAMLSVLQCFIRPRDDQQRADAEAHFAHCDGDHLTMLNAFHAFKQNGEPKLVLENYLNHRSLKSADNVRNQLVRLCTATALTSNPLTSTPKIITPTSEKPS